MKKCASCGEVKPIDEFHKSKSRKDGRKPYCKKCRAERAKNRVRTLMGKALQIYANQKERSELRGHQTPTYTKEEFISWLLSNQKYLRLYDNWVKSGYKKPLAPSCDRLDNYKGYSFENIRIVTWEENMVKGHSDVKNGLNNKQNKAVIKMDLNGNELKEYHSMRHAARQTGIYYPGIWAACNGRITKSGGFRWRYAESKKEK